ncbi:unnamed protein product [Caenorhabditis bovis]|uniref:Uncharacterized protein n=1 Tax=Caenorhabditis bovis TaxID=2654633 RepID=A0A8S1EAQ9_9PELO|nr:unnamed protein product [Caenorhabditis bovis]
MKIPHAIAEFVSEFSGINKTPDFKPIRSKQCRRCSSPCHGHSQPTSGTSSPVRKHSGDGAAHGRRQSVNIAVGVDAIPVLPQRNCQSGTNLVDAGKYAKNPASRRQSAPCISQFASTTSLKEKLNKLKSSDSLENDDLLKEDHEEEAEQSEEQHMSYRLV